MKKWTLFSSTAQNPNSPVVAQTPEAVPVIAAADAKQFGLENFGNTCYANSVLQALYFCGPFRDLVVQYPDASYPDSPFTLPVPPPPLSSPQVRPKPSRKQSVSEPPPSSVASCSTPAPSATPTFPMPTAPPTLLSALRSLYIYISRNPVDKGTVAPRAFIDKLKELNELFRSTMHQDAHEFLNYLLNQIVEEMDEDRKKLQNGPAAHGAVNGNGSAGTTPWAEDLTASIGSLSLAAGHQPSLNTTLEPLPFAQGSTLVHRLFEGTLTSETRCLTCETVSSRDESFLDLSIDIEQHSSVTACLRQFSASEMLCQRNKFFCDSCCDLQEAEKRMKIKKLPNILALHLKRFKYQEDVGKYIKLAYRVAFPLELRLFNTVDGASNPDRLYELFAIVVHIGNGPHHGHYVSIIKARGTWYLFDDDNVEAIREADIPKYFGDSNAGSAYVLYYQAADLDISALGLRPPEPANAAADSTATATTTNSSILESRIGSTPTGEAPNSHELLSPSVPPGLAVVTDQQNGRPSPTAGSPAFLASALSTEPLPIDTQAEPSLGLHISMPPPPSEPVVPSSPTVPLTPAGGGPSTRGFFNSLRHSPSLRIRPATSNGVSERRSTVDVPPPVPPIPITIHPPRPSTADNGDLAATTAVSPAASSVSPMSASLSASPSVSTVASSGGKERERTTTGTWFKRKSFRQDKPPLAGAVAGPLVVNERSASTAGLDEPATPWYKSAKRVHRRASEAGLMSPPSVASPNLFQRDQHASQPPTSVSSPLGPVPEHKKSMPAFGSNDSERQERRPSRRPSTAGTTIERPLSTTVAPPLPPLPSPRSPDTESDLPSEDHHTALPHDLLSPANGTAASNRAPRHASDSPTGLGFSTSNGTSSTLNTMHTTAGESTSASTGSSTKSKRATTTTTRKLSFSAPKIGFGRREKKEKERPQSPAYAQLLGGNR